MYSRMIVLVLAATTVHASAGSKTSGGGGGGRLGSVSRGIDRATPDRGSSRDHRSSSRNDSSSSRSDEDEGTASSFDDGDSGYCCASRPIVTWADGTPTRYPAFRMPRIQVAGEGFVGAQKVLDSDGALAARLSLELERRVRFTFATSLYFEDQMDGSRVLMNTPSVTIGLRLAGEGATRLWGEAGYQRVSTSDPLGSSAVNGATLGARLEHDLADGVLLVGSGGAMLFDDFRGFTGRIGARMNHVEVAFRVLDFDVGPALFGPEIGVGF